MGLNHARRLLSLADLRWAAGSHVLLGLVRRHCLHQILAVLVGRQLHFLVLVELYRRKLRLLML